MPPMRQGTIEPGGRRRRSVVRFAPWWVAVLVLVQWWLAGQLAAGQFGPTPSGVVFGAVLLWFTLCLGMLVAGVVEQMRGRRAVRPACVAFVFGCVGLAIAWANLQSFLEVA